MPVIDVDSCIWFERQKCQVCEKLCPTEAIDFEQKDEIARAGGGQHHHGHRLEAVRLPRAAAVRLRPAGQRLSPSLEFERLCNAAGPTGGKIVLRDGKTEPKSVAIIHCVGSRDVEPQRVLLGRLLHGGLEVRPPGAGEDQGRGLLVLHRHADQPEGLRGVLPAAAGGGDALRPRQGGRGDRRRPPALGRGQADRPGGRHALGQAAADPGGHGGPDGGAGAAGRRQGDGPEVRHLVQHGRLVHRAPPQARPGGHDDRRRSSSPAPARVPRTFPHRWPRAPRPPRGSPA